VKRVESLLIKEETLVNVVRLRKLLQENDSLAVIMYGSPDPDAVASAMALREIVAQKVGLSKCIFVATEETVRSQNILLFRAMRINVALMGRVNLAEYRLHAIVDAQPSFFNADLNGLHPNIVLDHHPPKTGWKAELVDIRRNYGALATIMTEYLLAANVRISRLLHTALLYGIKTDTNNFERDALVEDVGAYHFNYARANRQLLRRTELNQVPERFLKYFCVAFENKKRLRDRVVTFLGRVESADACVQVADFLLRLIDVYNVVVAGIFKDILVVVFRGDGYRQDCGASAGAAFGSYGKAGGHRSAARVEIPLETLKSLLSDGITQESVDRFLLERLQEKPTRRGGAK
jgi:nanoRNase/pAp phosphatase (c-di-AMP/oligoRNAs hydrolase)